MKFSCEKALLSAAVSTASRAVAPKSSIPALEGILIEAGATLRLTGYNLETGIQATVPAEIRETGSLVLSARLFSEIVRKMPDDMVTSASKSSPSPSTKNKRSPHCKRRTRTACFASSSGSSPA